MVRSDYVITCWLLRKYFKHLSSIYVTYTDVNISKLLNAINTKFLLIYCIFWLDSNYFIIIWGELLVKVTFGCSVFQWFANTMIDFETPWCEKTTDKTVINGTSLLSLLQW